MKKLIFGLLLSVCCLSPASAKYSERVLRLDAELKQYQVRDNVLNMAQYQGSNLIDDKVYPDEQAGSDFVASLNELIQYYPRVIDLYHLIHEISESGYLGENQNLIISDLEYALKKVVDQGFGTGRFESWGFQQMPTYSPGDTMPDGEPCEDMRENVFYTTVQHGSGEMIFGVHLSAGSGYVSQEQFEIGNLHEACN